MNLIWLYWEVFIIDSWKSRLSRRMPWPFSIRIKFHRKESTRYTKLKATVTDMVEDQQQEAPIPQTEKGFVKYKQVQGERR